jgi:hypothetical protein
LYFFHLRIYTYGYHKGNRKNELFSEDLEKDMVNLFLNAALEAAFQNPSNVHLMEDI